MEKEDLELIERLREQDPELKKIWDEHHEYERLLESSTGGRTSPPRKPWSGSGCRS